MGKYIHKSKYLTSEAIWFVIFILNLTLVLYIHSKNYQFPAPVKNSSAKPDEFVEENAREHLLSLSSLGARPVGSEANEVKAVEYLLKQLESFRKHSNNAHEMHIDLQTVSGTFTLRFLGEFTSYYENVQNVLVKLTPKGGAPDSLMVNCHFDSVINATGASDDAVSCCLMLESLRVLSQSEQPLKHSIIFVFNGAEENILQASHGFITQHPWASEIRAFVNLEAAGAGGRELLFQAGPQNPWMIQTYADNVPHPFASVFGQEVFESGLIPSDTDFRIYRDYGGLAGLDIAYISNGYVYHTEYDIPEMIPPGCIQRGGENLLSMLRSFALSPLLSDPGEYRHGQLVYFDVVGLFMVLYPARMGTIINGVVAAMVLVVVARRLTSQQQGVQGFAYVSQLIKALAVILVSWVLCLCVVILIGLALDALGCVMSWYSRPWLLLGLYACPAMVTLLCVHRLARHRLYKKYANMWEIERLYFTASLMIFGTILAVMTAHHISSAVIMLLWVVFPMMIREGLVRMINILPSEHSLVFLTLHTISTLPPSLMTVYPAYGVFLMFVPVMGRAGSEAIPDVAMGGLMAFVVILLTSHHLGLAYVCRSTKWTQRVLSLIFTVTLCAVLFTPLGFPYTPGPDTPKPQRHFIHHIERTMHDHTGAIVQHDTGLMHLSFDRNKMRYVEHVVPGLANTPVEHCDLDRPYCGWPFYFPLASRFRDIHYIPAPRPKVSETATLQVLNRTVTDVGRHRLHLAVTGPHHVNVYMTPRQGVSLSQWSLGNGDPHPTATPPVLERENYFVFYAYGKRPEKPWEFWLDLQLDKPESPWPSDGSVDIALGAHYHLYNGKERTTDELEKYLSSFPDWSTPIGWVATYEAWVL